MIKKKIHNRHLVYKRHVSFQEAFHNMSVSMLTMFLLFAHYFPDHALLSYVSAITF